MLKNSMGNMKTKLIIDIIMTLLIVTLFSKSLFGMQYHEIAGLVFVAIALVHNIVNFKTTCAMCKNFEKIPVKMKINLIVDILLILCFAYIGIGGILIAHTLPTGVMAQSGIMKMTHIFVGYLTIILLGIHIGLHIFKKQIAIKSVVALTAVAVLFGGYGFVNSNISSAITMPIAILTGGGMGGQHGNSAQGAFKEGGKGERGEKGESSQRPKGGENYKGEAPSGGAPQGRGAMSTSSKIETILMFAGMLLFFTMLTYWIAVDKKRFNVKLISKESV